MFILFDTIFILYSILYFPYLLLTKRWHPDYWQRFGFFSADVKVRLGHRGRNIWVHAVSVGEVIAIEGLIRRLRERWPAYVIVCSVTTKTGYELAQKRLGPNAIVIFSPLDLSFVVRHFSQLIRPKLYIAAETEIWPNLFNRLRKDNVPIAIINGRISDRSFGRYQCIKGLLKGVLSNVSVFAMQSDLDRERITILGAPSEKVAVIGNIKFDEVDRTPSAIKLSMSQPVWIAGSTHPGEEKIILDVFKGIAGWRLIIAPRHVDRSDEVLRLALAGGFKAVLFSQMDHDDDDHQVIVVDSIGHLRDLYSIASLVFVGKSLCVGGGHNIIEPAVFGKPIIVGPMTENFRDIVACFNQADALVQVERVEEFEPEVKALVADKTRRQALGERARRVIDLNQGALDRTLELVKPWL